MMRFLRYVCIYIIKLIIPILVYVVILNGKYMDGS